MIIDAHHHVRDPRTARHAWLGEFRPLGRPFNLADFEQASALDGVRFMLDHGAKPDVASGELEPWATLIAELARCPNIVCQLSGLVTEAGAGAGWTMAELMPYASHLLNCFGPLR